MSGDPVVSVRGVRKVYGAGPAAVEALRGVDLDLGRGELVGLVGPSGAGKTTLLNIIGALERPTAGGVLVDGAELFARGERDLSRYRAASLGFVFQDFNLFAALTAHENVEFPLLLGRTPAAERRRRVDDMLERVGVADKGRRFPEQLSGGEKQRVALGRALVHRPRIVLADEPTANLDSATGAQVIALLAALNRELGTTFLISTHDHALMGALGRVLLMRDGRLQDDPGPPPGGHGGASHG